jgi:hypothetical protein
VLAHSVISHANQSNLCNQVVASVVPGSSGGRSPLSRRLTARLRLAVMGYPDEMQLEAICERMLQQVSRRCCCSTPAHATLNLGGGRPRQALVATERAPRACSD